MNNVTREISLANNFFRQNLLGESLRHSFIRLTVILSAIIIVWGGIILALIIHMKCQRARQMIKTSNTQHSYDNDTNSNKKRSNNHKRNRRFDSSSSSVSLTRYSIRHFLSRLKRHVIFWPSSSTSTITAALAAATTEKNNSIRESLLLKKEHQMIPTNSNTIQILVENMTRRPLNSNRYVPNIVASKLLFHHETDSSSGDELKNFFPFEEDQQSRKVSNVIQFIEPQNYINHPSISISTSDNNDHETTERLQKLHEFNTKATLLFHPTSRRLSNTKPNSYLPPINTIQNQLQRKSLLVVSSARELTAYNKWQWKHSLANDPIVRDENITLSSKQLPLVMITDTNLSNTNIVELETYEDNHRLMTDLEKRLSQQLRASYRPRHST
ncbi:unnamed protein product [Adineta steineri]|uniref:Uncharacterized protein n=1 Tax=Adineta steineri TaxID=433720 RepID=A0A814N3W5_9BILA|nr:unnamed protein product [Adineta steineri]CAF3846335.1 unnamed protein product [Adineta steineri]